MHIYIYILYKYSYCDRINVERKHLFQRYLKEKIYYKNYCTFNKALILSTILYMSCSFWTEILISICGTAFTSACGLIECYLANLLKTLKCCDFPPLLYIYHFNLRKYLIFCLVNLHLESIHVSFLLFIKTLISWILNSSSERSSSTCDGLSVLRAAQSSKSHGNPSHKSLGHFTLKKTNVNLVELQEMSGDH